MTGLDQFTRAMQVFIDRLVEVFAGALAIAILVCAVSLAVDAWRSSRKARRVRANGRAGPPPDAVEQAVVVDLHRAGRAVSDRRLRSGPDG
jgi:hypothetical protein